MEHVKAITDADLLPAWDPTRSQYDVLDLRTGRIIGAAADTLEHLADLLESLQKLRAVVDEATR